MDWLKELAPTLFSALTGNIPGAIASGIGFVADKLGLSNPTLDDVKQKLAGLTPEQQLQFKAYELQFAQEETKRLQIESDNYKAQLSDVQNARAREIALAQSGKTDWLQQVVAYFVIGIFAYIVFYFLRDTVPVENKEMVSLIIGIITGSFKDIVGYLFGSSKGSFQKTKLLAEQSKK
jgi:hypothetical protein